jgi:predicted esterase
MAGGLTQTFLGRPHPDGPKPEVHGFHGGDDAIVRTSAGQATISTLSSLGYVADIKVLPGVGHDLRPAINDVTACVAAGAQAAVASP